MCARGVGTAGARADATLTGVDPHEALVTLRQIFEMIGGIEVREKPRVMLACLKNGKGDFEKLKDELTNARGWYRESILEAEYPNYRKKIFRIERMPAEEQESLFEADKAQYLKWLSLENPP